MALRCLISVGKFEEWLLIACWLWFSDISPLSKVLYSFALFNACIGNIFRHFMRENLPRHQAVSDPSITFKVCLTFFTMHYIQRIDLFDIYLRHQKYDRFSFQLSWSKLLSSISFLFLLKYVTSYHEGVAAFLAIYFLKR